jgi:hypothetical protein
VVDERPKPRLFFRPEHDQWSFASRRARAYDAAIIYARYLSPYPKGHPSYGKRGDRLATAVRTVERDVLIDPGTPSLMSRAVATHAKAARLRATPAARAVELPLTLDQLRRRKVLDGFVDACLQGQVVSANSAAPYLDFSSTNDERFEANLRMIKRTISTVGPQQAIAFVQMTSAKLRKGVLAETAPAIAATGVRQVILRVRDIGEVADSEDLDAYLRAQDAFLAAGLEVIIDCAGRLGPLFVHAGAAGFSTGPMHFRKVAQSLLAVGGGGGGSALRVEEYSAWRWVDRDVIGTSELFCPVAGCAVRASAELDDIREHNLHVLRHLAREMATWDTAAVIKSLRSSGDEIASEWANVFARRLSSRLEEQG